MLIFLLKIYNYIKEYIVLCILLVFSLFIISLNNTQAMNSIRTYSVGSFAIINSAFTNFVHLFYHEDSLLELKQRNAELMLENNILRGYAIQNLELKGLLKIQDTSKIKLVRSVIVSKLTSSVQGNLILDKGTDDGIYKGMPVINDKGLIGIVSNASSGFCKVKHINNSHFKIAVKDQRSGISGILNWDGTSLKISNIQGIDDILIGDRIVTSDFSTIFPPDIPVGIVKRKEKNSSSYSSTVIVEPFVKIEWISHVFIIPIIRNNQIDSLKAIK